MFYVKCIIIKDRQHQSRGIFKFSLVTHESKRVEYNVLCQMKARFILYLLILNNIR